jgi:hypothetical protein
MLEHYLVEMNKVMQLDSFFLFSIWVWALIDSKLLICVVHGMFYLFTLLVIVA